MKKRKRGREKSGGYRRNGGRRKREKGNKEISLGVACYYEGGGGKRRRSLCRGCLVGSSEAPTRCLTAFVWYFINTSANYFPFFLPDARPGLAQQKESGMRPYTSSPVPRCSLFLSLSLSRSLEHISGHRDTACECVRIVPRTHILHA